ncbi:MAG: xanthine permease [Rikenellaceae bacterium]|nr:xanthine permease [Rikenellaceae bacterium]
MELKYKLNDRPATGQLILYSLQWFVLAVAVVVTSLFISTGTPAEKILYAQKVFALMGITTIVQVLWGHRLPIVVGPAAVLLVGIIAALSSQGAEPNTNKIYTAVAIGGIAITILSAGRVIERMQKIFTPRIVVVILMLIAFTLAPTIKNLIFPAAEAGRHTFGLWFTILGVPAMAFAASQLKGVAKSLLVPISLIVGCIVYYAIYGGFTDIVSTSSHSEGTIFIPAIEFDASLILAFIFCYIALLINDIGSIQALGAMLNTDNTQHRCRRGVGVTGIFNIIAGAIGVIGPVNYSMSPGVIASSSCASRYALIPAGAGLIICALVPQLIAILTAIPNTIIGVVLLYLMGTQLAAAFSMLSADKSADNFNNALIVGLPIMIALLFCMIPMDVIPAIIKPLVGNGFVMGVISVIVLEHVILRVKR